MLGWQLLLAGVAAALIAYYGFLSYKSFKGALLWEDFFGVIARAWKERSDRFWPNNVVASRTNV